MTRPSVGWDCSPSEFGPRGIVGLPIEVSATGNVILRVGREVADGAWTQTEHVVLSADEAAELAGEIAAAWHEAKRVSC